MKAVRTVATTLGGAGVLAAALLGGFAAAGESAVAVAQPMEMPAYHWCPGDHWDPQWGKNWDAGNCHDDHHRDIDGTDHSRDFWG